MQGMVMFVYKYDGKGGRMSTLKTADCVGQTSYKITTKLEVELPGLMGGPVKYLLLPSLKSTGHEDSFEITATGDSAKPILSQLGNRDHNTQMMGEQWGSATSGGYMKAANPQFLLELPEGQHEVTVSVKRTDTQKNQGLAILAYKHGSGEHLAETDEALKTNYSLVAKSDMKAESTVDVTATLDGFPAVHMLMPCLQNAGVEGPLSLSVECKDCMPMLSNLRSKDDLPEELKDDLERVVASKLKTTKKFKKVPPPPGA